MKKTRKEAIESGDDYYDTQAPCKNGHLSPRRTIAGVCVECARLSKLKELECFKSAKQKKREA